MIQAGADIVMLPYFKTVEEVESFIKFVDGRAKALPLLETPEAVECIDDILELPGLDEIFVGLNDLSLGYKKKFMFELLTDGTLENLCLKFKQKNLSFGFGGIASLGKGEVTIGIYYSRALSFGIYSGYFVKELLQSRGYKRFK